MNSITSGMQTEKRYISSLLEKPSSKRQELTSDDEDVEKDLYIALLIQNQSLFNAYCDRDELHSIKQVFGDRMCRDLYERQQLLNLVHDHVIKEVQEA